MIKACLFDIGNVLVTFDYRRTFDRIAARTPRSLDEIGRHLSAASSDLETGRLSSGAFITAAVDFMGGDVGEEDFRAAFTGIFEPIAPVWEVVEAVREVVPVYLFSNTSELHESGLFKTFPVFSRFHGGFYSWRLGSMKPDAGMFEHAIARLGLPGEEIAYIDDLAANIEAGQRFGFRCHQYDRTQHGELVQFFTDCGLPGRRSPVTGSPPASAPPQDTEN